MHQVRKELTFMHLISCSFSDLKNQPVDLLETLSKTKYGSKGMGGIKGTGLMYVGYPR